MLNNDNTQEVRVDTGKALNFSESSFLLRIWLEENGTVLCCLIHHIASGREAYIQSGSNLYTFVKACLLPDSHPDSATYTLCSIIPQIRGERKDAKNSSFRKRPDCLHRTEWSNAVDPSFGSDP